MHPRDDPNMTKGLEVLEELRGKMREKLNLSAKFIAKARLARGTMALLIGGPDDRDRGEFNLRRKGADLSVVPVTRLRTRSTAARSAHHGISLPSQARKEPEVAGVA